jgi:predicted PurR-regulated permease PerM
MTKQLARVGIAVLTTLLALMVFWQFRMIIIYVMISLMLAATLRPLVSRLAGRKFLVRAGWILLYLAVLGSFGSFLFLTGETAMNEIQQFVQTVSVQDEWRLPVWLEGSSCFRPSLALHKVLAV